VSSTRLAPGTLYVVATPIGNLGDLSPRAAETLRTVDRIAAEDTRRSRALLSHLEIRDKPIARLDAHATARQLEHWVERLVSGESVALVTDAGTPAVSDPGAAMVRAAAARQVPIVSIPGPSALTAAISVSGLVEGGFLFLGFIPRSGSKRKAAIERIAGSHEPVVLLEAPNRVARTLSELSDAMPEREAAVSRELSKLHEQTLRGRLAELCRLPDEWRGEVTIVLGALTPEIEASRFSDDELEARIRASLSAGQSVSAIAKELSASSGRPKREVYARAQAIREADDGGR